MKYVIPALVLFATAPTFASAIFDDDSILEVTLSGPLTTVIKSKRHREELPFSLTVGNTTIDVDVRIRGRSRVVVCSFPPLRLDFSDSGPDGTAFEGANKLKLVTHCKNGSDKAQDSVLNEFMAYRIFNLISDQSYRVRLLKIRYDDTDGKQRRLDEPHYGFVIESDEGLARRLGGTIVEADAIRFSTLDSQQTARLSVFQYLIGNKDWSFVMADSDDTCCHNVDLLDVDAALVPIPYDFDLAALTRAKYRGGDKLNQSKRREYVGYCRTTADMLDQAINRTHLLKDDILSTVLNVPALDDDTRERRASFIAEYFEEAAGTDSLLARFERDCIGRQ